jgi:hypothetical protein
MTTIVASIGYITRALVIGGELCPKLQHATREENGMAEPQEGVIFITVSGGVAYVREDTVPHGTRVEIIDFDNLNESVDEYARLSPEAQSYVTQHFT